MTGGCIFLPTIEHEYKLKLDKSVAKGKSVVAGQRLGKLVPTTEGLGDDITLYSSTEAGWISLVHYQSEATLDPNVDSQARLLDLSTENPCQHDVVIATLCCACGETVKSTKYLTARFGGISLSKRFAETISQPKIQELYTNRKLMLILDLDHTLVHAEQFAPSADFLQDKLLHSFTEEVDLLKTRMSARDGPVVPGCVDSERQIIIDGRNLKEQFLTDDDDDDDVEYCQYVDDGENDPRSRYKIQILESSIFMMQIQCDGWAAPQSSHFKLRPGVFKFLREMSKLFELYIYTAGVQQHASTALSLLDPDRRFFPETHVFSRDAVSKDGVKSLSRVLPADHHAMVVIDDTPAAWDNDVGLFVCYPYVWFAPPVDHFVLPKHAFALDIKVSAFRRALWQYAPSRIYYALSMARAIVDADTIKDQKITTEEGINDIRIERGKENNGSLAQLWLNQGIESRFGETMPRELKDSDLQLFSLCGILRTCHHIYYAALTTQLEDPDLVEIRVPSLKVILDELKSRTLAGTRVYYGDPPPGWQNTQSRATFECLGCEVIHNDEIRTPTHILLSRHDEPPPSLKVPSVTSDWLEFAASTLTRPPDEVFDPRNARNLRVFWDACSLVDTAPNGPNGKRQRLQGINIRSDNSPQEWLEDRHLNSIDEIIDVVISKSDTTRPRTAIPLQSFEKADDLELALLEELGHQGG